MKVVSSANIASRAKNCSGTPRSPLCRDLFVHLLLKALPSREPIFRPAASPRCSFSAATLLSKSFVAMAR
eukprot:4374736-Heterocapsa_arctica.AAC.1